MKPLRFLDTNTARELAVLAEAKEYPVWLLWPAGRDRISDAVARESGQSIYWQTTVIASRLIPVSSPSVMVNVGANFGPVTVPLAKLRPVCTIWAFEPATPTYHHLAAHLFLNSLSNVRAERLALGEAQGTLPLYLPDPLNLGSSTLRPDTASPAIEVVRVLPLDALEVARERIDLLKISVSGGEAAVLRGAKATIARDCMPILLTLPASGVHRAEALSELAELGYDSVELFPGQHVAAPIKRLRSVARRSRT